MATAMNIPATSAMRRLVAAALLCMAPWTVQAAAEDDKPADFEDEVSGIFWWGDFDRLEQLYAQARRSTAVENDGRTQLAHFRSGIRRVFRGHSGSTDFYYEQIEALTRAWATSHPQSSLAQLMLARALHGRAWRIRGEGFASTVPAQAWDGFNKYVRLAIEQLSSQAKVVADDPTTHFYLLNFGRSAGWPRDKLWSVLQDGVQRHPEDDVELYGEMVFGTLPKWGGDAAAIDAVIADAVRRSGTRGPELYARLYTIVADDLEGSFYRQTKADWRRIQQGYRDMMTRYTGPWIVNRFARMACQAEDRPTTRELLEKVGPDPALKEWGSGDTRGYFDLCSDWARSDAPQKEPPRPQPAKGGPEA